MTEPNNPVEYISNAKDKFLNGAKSVAEYPMHLMDNTKEIVKYVEKPVSTIKTWMKFVAVMLAATLLIYQLHEKIRSYVENPVIVSPEYSYVDKLSFPGVILCNNQPLRYSYVAKTALAEIFEKKGNQNSQLANEVDLRQFYMNASQPANDYIVRCNWPSSDVNCTYDHFDKIMTDYGPCYRLKAPIWPNTTTAGPVNPLKILINVETDDGMPMANSQTLGTFVALFPYNYATPVVSYIGFNVPPGFEASIAVTSESSKRLEINKKGACRRDKTLLFFANYTTTGCYLEDKFLRVVNACQCLPYNMPQYRNPLSTIRLPNSLSVCNAELQNSCVDTMWKLETNGRKDEDRTCPEACEVYQYSSEQTFSLISSLQLNTSLSEQIKEAMRVNFVRAREAKGDNNTVALNDEYFRNNFIILNIYFKELVHIHIRQYLMYEGFAFAGDIAGTVGIILGFLITTLGEVIDNCCMLYRKAKGLVDSDKEKVVKIVEHNSTAQNGESTKAV